MTTEAEQLGAEQAEPVLAVRGLGVTYRRGSQRSVAVHDVTMEVCRGEVVGFIGESGAGKSTVARSILGLVKPTAGSIEITGKDMAKIPRREGDALRTRVQAIMQNPYGSLDPRWRVGKIIAEPMHSARRRRQSSLSRSEIATRVADLLSEVGLSPDKALAWPAQLSGGERQRVAVARALSVSPVALVADEPVTALDNTSKRQILDLIERLHRSTDMGILLISHSMSFIAELADRVYVITDGEIVESGPVGQVIGDPHHPYTRRLIEASRVLDNWDPAETIVRD